MIRGFVGWTLPFVYELLLFFFDLLIFFLFEKSIKSNWIILDSFRRAEKVFLRTIDSIPHPCYITTLQGRILYMNQPGVVTILTNNNFYNIIYPNQRKLVEKAFRKVSKTIDTQTLELLIKTISNEKEESFIEKSEQHGTKYMNTVLRHKEYNYYKVAFKRFSLNTSICILIVCNNIEEHKRPYSFLISNSKQLRSQLRSIHFPSTNQILTQNMQAEFEKNRYRIKLVEYINESSLLLYEESLAGLKPRREGFNVTMLLIYLIEVLFNCASDKRIEFELIINSLNAKEIIGEKCKLEIILLTLLSYFVEYSEQETISLTLTKSNEYLRFEISCTTHNEYTEYEYLNKIIFNSKTNEDFGEFNLCTELIKWMKGCIRLIKNDKGTLIQIDLPFIEYDNSLILTKLPIIETPKFIKVNDDTYVWLWKDGGTEIKEESKAAGGHVNEYLNLEDKKKVINENIIQIKDPKVIAVKEENSSKSKLIADKLGLKNVLNKEVEQKKPQKDEVVKLGCLYGTMRKLRDRNEVMNNINGAVIFNRIITAGGKNPEIENRKPEDPKLLEERKGMQQELNDKQHMDKMFNVQKGKIKKRSSEKELANVFSKDDIKELRKDMVKVNIVEYCFWFKLVLMNMMLHINLLFIVDHILVKTS